MSNFSIGWQNKAHHHAAITSQSIIIILLVFRRALNLHGSWVPDCNYLVGWSRLDLSPLCKGNCSVAQRDKRRDLPGQNTVTGLILHYIHKTTIIIYLMIVCVTHELYWLPLTTGCWMVVGVESFSHEQSIVTRTFVRKPCWHGHKQTVYISQIDLWFSCMAASFSSEPGSPQVHMVYWKDQEPKYWVGRMLNHGVCRWLGVLLNRRSGLMVTSKTIHFQEPIISHWRNPTIDPKVANKRCAIWIFLTWKHWKPSSHTSISMNGCSRKTPCRFIPNRKPRDFDQV